ncbi:cytochrome P450 [Streptomyces violascens]|uniref:cytochrome P450 n=1 Tax=Streptomyces violascens TaxID=67381 RepID=UPI0036C10A7D
MSGALAPFRLTGSDLPDPYSVYRRYRQADPVHLTSGAWHLFRHEDVSRALTDRRLGRSAATAHEGGSPPPPRIPGDFPHLTRTVANWMVFLDPPRHTRIRALVVKAFTPKVVEGLRPRIRALAADLANELTAALHRDGSVDLVDAFAAPLPIQVISELLGVPRELRTWFRARAVGLQQATSTRTGRAADAYAVADRAARELDEYFRSELAARRGTGRADGERDLIAGMMAADDDGEQPPLSDDELAGTFVHLLTAGHETTTNLLAKGLLALLRHPDQLALLRARPELMPGAAEELIRYDSPVQTVSRWAYADVGFGSRTVRRGDRVVLVLGSANRDPERFTAPDRLDLTRDARRHCGFGLGIHYCLGAALARAEAETALAELLRVLPESTAVDQPVRYAEDLVFHGPSSLVLRAGSQAARISHLSR